MQSKVEETEKLKYTISESTKQTITNLSKEKNDLLKKIQFYQIENENLKKLVTIKDNKEKELLKKIEEYPFLQQKLRALESILKVMKITKYNINSKKY